MDGETEHRQDVDVVEEQTDGVLLLNGVDITQPWVSAQLLAAARTDHVQGFTGTSHLSLRRIPHKAQNFRKSDRLANT